MSSMDILSNLLWQVLYFEGQKGGLSYGSWKGIEREVTSELILSN